MAALGPQAAGEDEVTGMELPSGVHGGDKVGHWSGGVMRLRAA